MAFMVVESLAKNKSSCVQISGKILELLLLTVGLISTVLVMKEALLPYYSTDFVLSSFKGFWSLIIRSSPPSIIIAINLMVLLIFASSTFYCRDNHHLHSEITLILDVDDQDLQINQAPAPAPPPRDVVEITPPPPPPPPPPPLAAPVVRNKSSTPPTLQRSGRHINDDVSVMRNNTILPPPKPLPKTNKTRSPPQLPSPTPRPLEKWKNEDCIPTNGNEDDDTMEATWEAITGQASRGGWKHKTKKKQSRIETTWGDVDVDAPPQVRRLDSEEVVPSSPKWKELRKAETFNDAVSLTRRGGLVRRVPSMSLEDFNHKVEAFIHTIKHHTNKPNRTFFDIINRKRH